MKDNFDLKKFLKENKAFEQFNPFLAESEDKEKAMRDKIREYILSELAENMPNDYDYEEEDIYGDYDDDESGYFSHMKDLEDSSMEDELDEAFSIFGKKDKVNYKTVIAQLMGDNKDIVAKIQAASTPQEKATIAKESGLLEKALKAFLAIRNIDSDVTGNMNEFKRVLFGDTRSFMQKLAAGSTSSVYEAKKDKETDPEEETVEDVEVTDTEEFQPDAEMDTTPELEGDEKEIMNNLETALEFAKQKGDEKLIDQIGNTITFFTRQYIVK